MSERPKIIEMMSRNPVEKVTLALAEIQGAWNKESKKMLEHQYDSAFTPSKKNDPFIAKIVEGLADPIIKRFMGDGSTSLILGHPIVLPEKDRGLIALAVLVGDGVETRSSWAVAALLSAEIDSGKSFEDISKDVHKGLIGFVETLGNLWMKIIPDDKEMSKELNKLTKGNPFAEIYGGSDEAFRSNKDNMQNLILGRLKRKINLMDSQQIEKLIGDLSTSSSDDMVNSSMASAKSIFVEILKSRTEDINQTLSMFS